MWYFSSDCICGKRPFFHSWNPPIPSLIPALSTLVHTFGLVKGSYFNRQFMFRPTDSLLYGVSIKSSLPSLHLVSQSQTVTKVVWLRMTNLHHCSDHSSRIARTFDRELRRSANPNKHSHLSAMRITCSHVTNCQIDSHGKLMSSYWTMATAKDETV